MFITRYTYIQHLFLYGRRGGKGGQRRMLVGARRAFFLHITTTTHRGGCWHTLRDFLMCTFIKAKRFGKWRCALVWFHMFKLCVCVSVGASFVHLSFLLSHKNPH